MSSNVDWEFICSVSSQKAEEKLDAFAKKAKTILNTIPGVEIKVNTGKADEDVDKFVGRSLRSLSMVKDTTLRIKATGALKDLQSFSRVASSVTNKPYTANVNANVQGALTNIAQVKTALNGIGRSTRVTVGTSGGTSRSLLSGSSLSSLTREVENQTKAVDFLGKSWQYSMLKLMEYEVIAKGVEAVVHGLTDSLKQASDIQFEQTLQKLYAPKVFGSQDAQNESLKNAISIARQWGADIRDVLQVQGLWTKQTHDLTSASYLAAEAEKMHRASGVDTVEVYEKSIAMASQLGITLDKLPALYDQVAEAALKVAVPMNNFQGGAHKEAMKDLLEGAAKGMATFKSFGLNNKEDVGAGALAIVGEQLQATSEGAKVATQHLTTMFAAMEGSGTHRKNMIKILGDPKDLKSFDQVIQKFSDKAPELLQALANGDIGVRPQQMESLMTFLGTLKQIKALYDDIKANSHGKLDLIAQAEMETFKGQIDRTKASLQDFGQALGMQILPQAMDFLHWLQTVIPLLAQNAGAIANVGEAAFNLGRAYLAVQVIQKGFNVGSDWIGGIAKKMEDLAKAQTAVSLTSLRAQTSLVALRLAGAPLEAQMGALRIARADSIGQMQAEMAQMEREKAVLGELTAQEELLAWRTTGAADAFAKFGLSVQEGGDLAAASAPKLAIVANGISAIGEAALRQIGPIALMMAAIQSADALDKDKNAEAGLRGGMENLANNGNYTLSQALTSPQFALGNALGRNNEFYQGFKDLHDIARTPGDIGASAKGTIKNFQVQLKQKADLTKQLEDAQNESTYGIGSPDNVTRLQSQLDVVNTHLRGTIDQAVEIRRTYAEQHRGKTSVLAKEQARWAEEAKQQLAKQNLGQQDTNLPAPNTLTVDRSMATPEAINRNQMEAVKRDAMAAMTVAQDLAEAGKMDEETVKKQAQLHGWSAKGVADLNAAYKEQIDALGQKAAAANQEVYGLKRSEEAALHLEAAQKKGSKAQLEAAKTADMAHTAWEKAIAQQRMLKSSIEETRVAQELANQTAQVAVELSDGDKTGPPVWLKTGAAHTVEEFRALGGEAVRKVDEARKGGGLSGEAAELASQSNVLAEAHKKLNKAVWEHPNDSALLAAFKALKEAEIELKGKTEELPGEFDKLSLSIQRIGQKSALKNADDAAEALGMDKRTINAVRDYMEQLNAIQDEREQLKDKLHDIGTGDSPEAINARNMVYWSQQQLDIQEKMLPIIEQHKILEDDIAKIRKSAEYTSLDKSLNREGDNLLNQIIKRDFTESTRPTFDTKLGGRPTKSGGVLSGFFQDYTQTAGGDAIKSVTGHLLDGIFPVDKLKAQEQTNRDELKHIYTVAVSGQLTAAQMMLQASKNQQASAGVSSGDSTGTGFKYGPPAPNHGGATGTGFTYGPQAALAATGAAISEISKATKLTAWNTDTNGNPSGMAASFLAKMDETSNQNPLGTFGAKGGFLGSSKSGKGGQNFTLGNIMAGMGEGAAASQMFGTSGPWGSILGGVGGAFGPIGAAAGSIIGGLFGPHYNATKNPDMFNPAYGQWLSNMSGTQNMVNGTPVDPSKQFNTYLGYQSESQQMASYVNSAQMVAELPPALKQFAQNIKGLENAAGGGLGIASEHNGIATLDSGKTVSVADYMNWTNELQQYKDQMANVPIAPLISMNAYGGNGMNVGGGKGYSTIGLTPQEVNALQLTAYGTKLNPSQAGPVGVAQPQTATSPYATPFTGQLGTSASQPIYVTSTGQSTQTLQTINLVVDSKVLATVVNAQNNQTLNAAGKIAA